MKTGYENNWLMAEKNSLGNHGLYLTSHIPFSFWDLGDKKVYHLHVMIMFGAEFQSFFLTQEAGLHQV